MTNKTGFIYDPKFLQHLTADSPECPERLTVILHHLQKDKSFWNSLTPIPPRTASEADILRCHTPNLIHTIKSHTPKDDNYYMLDMDTIISRESYSTACLAAGSTFNLIDDILSTKLTNGFCLIRPPGHHATRDQAMGFCLFNNAAIAARYIQTHHSLKNILIVDWDVHHGNGTQDIFYSDPSVFYFSMHEYPFYPGTGAESEMGIGAGVGTTLNIPLPAATSNTVFRALFTGALKKIESVFKPDFIIISAGFDARLGDPIGELQLLPSDYLEMTREVKQMAEKYCHGRVISVLEGGYLSDSLGEAVKQHIIGLLN